MPSYILVVKGNAVQALEAASKRHIVAKFQAEWPDSTECTLVASECTWEALAKWFHEDLMLHAPYAPGSLLHFSEITPASDHSNA